MHNWVFKHAHQKRCDVTKQSLNFSRHCATTYCVFGSFHWHAKFVASTPSIFPLSKHAHLVFLFIDSSAVRVVSTKFLLTRLVHHYTKYHDRIRSIVLYPLVMFGFFATKIARNFWSTVTKFFIHSQRKKKCDSFWHYETRQKVSFRRHPLSPLLDFNDRVHPFHNLISPSLRSIQRIHSISPPNTTLPYPTPTTWL